MKKLDLPKVVGANNGVVMLNNAATTPPFEATLEKVQEYLKTYGALHRGAGPNANKTVETAKHSIDTIRKFINADDKTSLLFTQNTSAAINLFVRLLGLKNSDVILTSSIEHTSNNLPYGYNSKAKVIYVNAFDDGSIDYEDLERKAEKYRTDLKLIAITGASNLTGYIPDIKRISKVAHAHGALIFVDAAQLAPHRSIDMQIENIDALGFSAHKVYAPFGLGVLALPKHILDKAPVDPGGGSIDMLSDSGVVWASPEARHQTGTWNVTGIVATGASCEEILKTGWNKIVGHEKELVAYAAEKFKKVPNITFYVDLDQYLTQDRIGTFVFNVKGFHYALLSSILDNEYGIETRAGTICNHKLVRRWFKVSDQEQEKIEKEIQAGDRLASYGIVRASLGIQNTKKDIDKLVAALIDLQKGQKYKYHPVPQDETYAIIK
jgi:cysteine desulfurase / selenocysteine lyase